jgi:hypothetical protein
MLEGVLRPSKTVSTFKEGSITDGAAKTIDGEITSKDKSVKVGTRGRCIFNNW